MAAADLHPTAIPAFVMSGRRRGPCGRLCLAPTPEMEAVVREAKAGLEAGGGEQLIRK